MKLWDVTTRKELLTFLKDYICPRHILEDMVRSDARPWATTIA